MKLLKIISALCLCAVLASCNSASDNVSSESISEVESHSQPSSSAPESSENSSEENKPDNGYLGTVFYIDSYIDIYKKAVETNETRPILIHNEDGVPNSIGEAPATEYWIVDKDGNNFIDHPFYDFSFFPIIKDDSVGVIGCYKGDYYRYEFIDGHFKRTAFEESGVFGKTVYNNHPGYVPTRYCYETFERAYGISDKDGNSILTFAPSKQYQSVVVCSPDLKKGTTYTVSTGGTSTGEEKDGLYSNGTYSGGTEYESAEISSLVTSVGKQGGMNNGENMKNGGGRRNMEGGERPQDKQNNSQSEGNI